MFKKFFFTAFISIAILAIFSGCFQPEAGEAPAPVPEIEKWVEKSSGRYSLKIASYIDVGSHNPLNAGDYTLEDGTLYFDYVILGAAQIKRPGGPQTVVNLHIPSGLQYVLDNRQTLIEPLRKKGIKVLLGITGGGDDISFGNIMGPQDDANPVNGRVEFYLERFAETVANLVSLYQLDGVELFDTNAAKSPPNPATYPYPDGSFEGDDIDLYPDDPLSKQIAWGYDGTSEGSGGGKQISYLTLLIRNSPYMADIAQTSILVREINYGAYIAREPVLFTNRSSYVNFCVNSEYGSFGSSMVKDEEGNVVKGSSTILEIPLAEYGPLAIDLGGVTPPIYDADGNDIKGFSNLFMESPEQYGILFYNTLVPASFENYTDTRPDSPTFNQKLTQADIMSISSEIIFGQKVVRNGGDHSRTW